MLETRVGLDYSPSESSACLIEGEINSVKYPVWKKRQEWLRCTPHEGLDLFLCDNKQFLNTCTQL